MKLTLYPYNPFEIEHGKISVVQTNNPAFYSNMIRGLNGNDSLVISENDEIIDLKRGMSFLGDVANNQHVFDEFKLDIQMAVLNNLKDDNRQELFRLDRRIKDIFLKASFMESVPIEIDEDWDIKKICKYVGIKTVGPISETPYDIINTILNLFKQFNSKKLITLNGLFNYLNSDQVVDLIQVVKVLDLNVLILNFSDSFKKDGFEECRNYFVDSDFVRWS